MDMTAQAWPDWYDGRHINEVLFCQQFLDKHPMKCVRGRLFTVDGLIEDEGQIGNLILEEISGVLTSGLSKVVTNLLASIKLQAYSPPLPIETDRIHVANGTYFMDGSFTPNKSYCNNRLTVSYNPDAPTPKRWLQFLSELLQQEDIPTLQEFLGYCLLPTTKGQKMLMHHSALFRGPEAPECLALCIRTKFFPPKVDFAGKSQVRRIPRTILPISYFIPIRTFFQPSRGRTIKEKRGKL